MNQAVKWLMEYLDSHDIIPELAAALALAEDWASKDHGYASKNQRIREYVWSHDSSPFYEIVTHIFAGCLMHPEGMTYQAMIGYVSGNIACADPLDRAKCAAEVIALCYQADLIVIEKVSDKTFMVTTEFELPIEIPEFDKHMPLFRKPSEVAYNPILGGAFKQHAGDVCRDHIDRMNAIPLELEYRVICQLPETTKAALETDEEREQWEDFKRRSLETYSAVAAQQNKPFYLEHKMDTRGRCYCVGYYVNYQGSQYKKAIVQLANKELVRLD